MEGKQSFINIYCMERGLFLGALMDEDRLFLQNINFENTEIIHINQRR